MAEVDTQRWTNRIIGHGFEDPQQLLANPNNWRIHPKAQQDALMGVLDDIGWVASVKVNQATGFVVDGHARVALSISRGEASIPVDYLELTPEEEALVLATFDSIGMQAGADPAAVRALLEHVRPSSDVLAAQLEKLAGAQEFHPAMTPDIEMPHVTDRDVERTDERLSNQFQGGNKELVEVTCPKCGATFFEDPE
jgi:hypothetical protein